MQYFSCDLALIAILRLRAIEYQELSLHEGHGQTGRLFFCGAEDAYTS